MARLTDAQRAEVAAELMLGASIYKTAKKYSLSTSTVSAIRESLEGIAEANRKADEIEAERFEPETESLSIDRLIVQSLQNHLKMQTAITQVASDSEYLKKQNASDLSRLLEVSQDHVIRLLEAASDAGAEG